MESLNIPVQPFFEWLLRATFQASLLICLILLLQVMLRGKLGPRWCHALWLLLLIRMVMPWAPQSRASIFNLIPRSIPASRAEYARDELTDESSGPVVTDVGTSDTSSVPTAAVPQETPKTPTETAVTREKIPSRLKPAFLEAAKVLPLIWLAGALALAIYVCANNFALLRIVRRERPLTDQKILDLLEDCKAQMNIRIVLGIVATDKVKSPALFGFVRPRLLLPAGMVEGLSHEELRYVFLHELAHLKRHDIYLGWLTSILQVLHWFNPLIWLAFYRMRADRELACDALVLARTQSGQAKDYGRTIVSLLERFSRPQPLPSMAGILETKAQLKRRITMIARFKKTSYQWSPLAVALIVLLGAVSLPNAIGSKKPEVSWPKSEPSISLRRIKTGPMSDFSSPPSLDGRYLCDVQSRAKRLVIRDLVTGEVRPLTEVSEGPLLCPVISPESKHVAYIHQSWSSPKNELQLIRIDGTGHRVIYRFREGEQFYICTWTPDGKQILGAFQKGDQDVQLVGFSIKDGSMQVIHTLGTNWPAWRSPFRRLAISPDGRYIAYDCPQEEGSWAGDIVILDIERQQTERVVQHPAYDRLLGWTPDGSNIFFASNRRQGLPGGFTVTDTCDAYLLPVAEGRQQGAPELIKRDIPGKIRPKGFTRDGAYYYAIEFKTIEAVVVKLDLQTGNMLKKPQAVGQTGADQLPTWSPDGRHLAYCVHQLNNSQTIRIQNLETSQERELDPNLPHFSWLRWSPDGKSLLVSNFDKDSPRAIYRINASTGERVAVVQSESSDTLLGRPQLSPDGSTLYYVLCPPDSKKTSLVTRDTESGREEELFSFDGTRNIQDLTFALSPDGRQLALKTNKFTSSGAAVVSRILTMPSKGGEPRELWKTVGLITEPTIAWTPDGHSLLFTKRIPEGGRELWLIPADGGQARKLCTPQEMRLPEMMYGGVYSALDVHPDGQRIAFDCFEYRHEVWVMENFLPEEKVAHKPTFRKIRIPTKPGNGVLSPDGEKLAFVSKGSVWVVPVHGKVSPDIAGEPVRLPGTKGAWRWGMRWSADGKWIAYNIRRNNKIDEIHVISSTGGEPKKIPVSGNGVGHLFDYRLSLSPDGKVLAFASREKEKIQLFTVNVEGGDMNQLTEDGGTQPAFSPDGKKIAYVKAKPQKTEIPKRDVWVIPTEGGTPVQVSDLTGRATGPIWSPDGKMIAFTRKAADDASKEICIVPVSETGNPEASPTQIELPLTTWNFLAGWTPDSKIGVLLANPEHQAIYTVPASGGNATQVTPQGYTFHPRWSPDGKRIFFRWDGIASVPSEGGEISIGPLDADSKIFEALPGGGNAVSPDGKKIVFSGAKTVFRDSKRDYEVDIYTIPIEGGEPKKLTISPGQDRFPCWSPNGEKIAFIRYPEPTKEKNNYIMNICIVSTEGGEVRQLTSESHRVKWSTIAWSPDGKSIAYFSEDKAIKVIPVQGGEPRVVVKVEDVSSHSEVAWSPDGSKLVYSSKGSIWAVSLDGGEPEEIKTGLDAKASHISWSPDGEKIAFTAMGGGDTELWVMENFLPGRE